MIKRYRCYTCKINKKAAAFYLVKGRVSQNECRPCSSKRRAADYLSNPEKFKEKRKAYSRKYPEKLAAYHRKWRWKLKLEVIEAYGGRCSCKGCVENRKEFLSLEHPNGGGNRERLKVRAIGTAFYSYVKKLGFPERYTLLCFNCNCSLGFYGYCPHVTKTSEEKAAAFLSRAVIGKRGRR